MLFLLLLKTVGQLQGQAEARSTVPVAVQGLHLRCRPPATAGCVTNPSLGPVHRTLTLLAAVAASAASGIACCCPGSTYVHQQLADAVRPSSISNTAVRLPAAPSAVLLDLPVTWGGCSISCCCCCWAAMAAVAVPLIALMLPAMWVLRLRPKLCTSSNPEATDTLHDTETGAAGSSLTGTANTTPCRLLLRLSGPVGLGTVAPLTIVAAELDGRSIITDAVAISRRAAVGSQDLTLDLMTPQGGQVA